MSSLVEFLRHVLPADGFKCAVILGPKGAEGQRHRHQRLFNSVEELAASLLKGDSQGHDAYFGCASYATPDNRKQTNAKAAKSFWLDIDAGPGKAYASVRDAVVAVRHFAETVGLPLPTIVVSGNGVHAYWVLDRDLDAIAWRAASIRFKEIVARLGLVADPTRTADIASILRPIECHNWKDRERPLQVVLAHLSQPINTDAMLAFLTPQINIAAKLAGADVSLGQMKNETYEASHAAVAALHCRQLQHFRDTRGNISEPLWYANLGVLAHCEDGERLAQQWSDGHPGYAPDDTASKLAHARAASGPTTCDRFRSIEPAGCAGCPYAVASPIQLGREERIAIPTITSPTISEGPPVNGHAVTMPGLPFGFKWGKGQALIGIVKSNDEAVPDKEITLSRYPVYLRSIQRTEQGERSSLEFGTWFPHDGWKFFCLPARDFYGTQGFSALAEQGVSIHTLVRPHFMSYVQRAQDDLREKQMDAMRFEQFGWKDDGSFLAGNVLYRPSGTPTLAALTDDLTTEAKKIQPSVVGSVGEWGVIADQLFQQGREVQGFTMLAGFAAPLLQFCGSKEGGVIISLESNRSGTGKSTAAYAALSIWGKPEGMKLIQRDNQVPLFHTFAQYRNLPILFDDMTKRDPQILRDLVISFTDGRDKKRGQRDGTTQRTLSGWNTILITTSNRSMVDILQADGDTAQAARVFEFHMPEVPRAQIDNSLITKFSELAGHAGPPWANYIAQTSTQEWLRRALPQVERAYMDRIRLGGDGRFIARLLASVDISARLLVNALGALHFDPDALMVWAVEQARRYVAQIELGESSQSVTAIVTKLINDHYQDCLIVEDKWRQRTPALVIQLPKRSFSMRYERKEQRLLVNQVVMREWLSKVRMSYADIKYRLTKEGVLLSTDKKFSLSAGTDLPGGQVPVWEIDLGHPNVSGQVRLVDTQPLRPVETTNGPQYATTVPVS